MLNILRLSGFPIILLFTSTLFAQAAVLSEDYVSDHMDFLFERMTQEGPKTNLDHILTENAGLYGRAVNLTNFSDSELNLTQTSFDGIYLSEGMHSNTGYTRRDNSMSRLLPTSVLGNANLERLYTQNAALRNQSGIELPASFAPLVRFIKDYINANDFADSERANGITHQSLAVQIVRASFCFGNDPFMIASKMRQETSFKRSLISSGSAVGFSQMTGGKFGGIAEVRHQMSGNATLAPANALATYRQAIRCFTGLAPNQYTFPSGTDDAVKVRLRSSWAWDMIFGQIMTKALISYTKSSGQYPNNNAANKVDEGNKQSSNSITTHKLVCTIH